MDAEAEQILFEIESDEDSEIDASDEEQYDQVTELPSHEEPEHLAFGNIEISNLETAEASLRHRSA